MNGALVPRLGSADAVTIIRVVGSSNGVDLEDQYLPTESHEKGAQVTWELVDGDWCHVEIPTRDMKR